MKILVIKFRHIGDVLLSTPLIENLKHCYPEATIDFALNKGCEDILADNPYINNIIVYNRAKIKKLNFFLRLLEEIKFTKRIRSNKYDLVINLTEGERGAQLTFFSNAKMKLGFSVRKGVFSRINVFDLMGNDQIEQHTVEKDLQFINFLEKDINNKVVSVFWPKNIEQEIDKILNDNKITDYVHIHPVSRWMFKCWEDERMAEIIDFLQKEKNIKVIITGAPVQKEKDRIRKILSLCKTSPLDLSGILSLKHLAYLSFRARFFFGVDTAPMHIAAATGTPVIALFGASQSLRWGPWNNCENTRVAYKNINANQINGQHIIISRTNHTIFYDKYVKKCKGMVEIEVEDVKNIINDII